MDCAEIEGPSTVEEARPSRVRIWGFLGFALGFAFSLFTTDRTPVVPAQDAVWEIARAFGDYHRTHGQFPASIEELEPKWVELARKHRITLEDRGDLITITADCAYYTNKSLLFLLTRGRWGSQAVAYGYHIYLGDHLLR